jgi:hypothetical protein
MTSDDNADDRYNIAKIIVLSGWALTLLVCWATIIGTVWLILRGHPVDDTLKGFAQTSFGFLFGSFVALVKDFMPKPH